MQDIAQTMVAVLSALATAGLFIWIYRGFMPVLEVRVIPRWAAEESGLLIVRLEVENKSRIGLKKKLARFQILEHPIPDVGLLSEWIPFAQNRVREGEAPAEWREPREVLTSTVKIEPGETIAIELLCRCSVIRAVHCGFQFIGILNPLASLAYLLGAGTDSWTRTTWIVPRPIKGNPLLNEIEPNIG